MSIDVLPARVFVCCMHAWGPWRSEEGVAVNGAERPCVAGNPTQVPWKSSSVA